MATSPRSTDAKPAGLEFTTLLGEQQELSSWIEYAKFRGTRRGSRKEFLGQLICRLPFNLAMEDRFGHKQVLMVRSHSLGDDAAVLFARHKMPLFNEVWIQLDDGTDRAWVRGKVTENVTTIGGQLVRVEYLARPAPDS